MIAFISWVFIRSDLKSARFLTETERDFAGRVIRFFFQYRKSALNRVRLLVSSTVQRLNTFQDIRCNPTSELETKVDFSETQIEVLCSKEFKGTLDETPEVEVFEWSEVRRGILEPQVWMIGLGNMMAVIGLNSVTYFL